MRGSLPLQQSDNDEDHQDEDQEGHREANVERQVGGCDLSVAGLLLLTVRVLEDGQVFAQLRPTQQPRAVLAGDVLALAIPSSVSRSRLRAGPPSEGEAVCGAGGPGAPPRPVSVHRRADLGAGFLLNGRAVTARPALDVDGLRRVAGSLSHLNSAAALNVALRPGSPVSPAPGV